MDRSFKERFLKLWETYFPAAELPVAFWYASQPGAVPLAPPAKGHVCTVCQLAQVRRGQDLAFDASRVGCFGGKRFLGFTQSVAPTFNHFISCGIPGKVEGERYKRTPEQVAEWQKHMVPLDKTGQTIVFKRWDRLADDDQPEVVIVFATPDVLSGLFTLANFDEIEPNGVFTPFSAGCGTIVYYPYLEIGAARKRAVIGMFDPSARPCVPAQVLTFAAPMAKFWRMAEAMEESFLITPTWDTVRRRISGGAS
jgi:hypothetical protein